MGFFDGLFKVDMTAYYFEFFIVAIVIAAFVGGFYLLVTGKSRMLGILLAGGSALYAFLNWG
jgi:hypothetical protein